MEFDLEPVTYGVIGLVALSVLILMGVRIFVAAGLVGLVGLAALRNWDVAAGISGIVPHQQTTSYALSVLPLFILIGFLAHFAGIIQGAYRCARAWMGWMPGGLAIGTIFATAGFAAVSGASTATSAVFARVAIPELLRYDYHPRLAAAVVAAGGTLATLIPPSAILVVYGIIVEQSIGALLLAGFIPGIISALIYAGLLLLRFRFNPALGRPITDIGWDERLRTLPEILPILVVVAIVMGGMYTGWATPTEVGALGSFVVFVMALMRGGLTARNLWRALLETARLTVMIFSIIWGVLIFVRFLAFAGLPGAFSEWIVALPLSPLMTLLMILAGYMVLGMFMNGIGMLLLTLPVVFPAVVALGYDPIWFGIIVVKMVEIGLITPPIGLNCFVVAGVRPDIPLQEIFRGVWPFVVADLLTVGVFIAFPELILFLPRLMMTG
ncbi:C4-dicarboxylate ABC transporter [Caldovatus sediminis]|uniref:C4-dicarboxylate ABC transporter n=1 Tax=Caldovatus sediminis TaxID=2041189 RepID=A0A8J3EBK6_9PROT|nr:TRAP transporter large permease [Caldovatus sediminis]GGG38107.1 C4-dicarboxylate ABC transporter [Caldovatus sediminis]